MCVCGRTVPLYLRKTLLIYLPTSSLRIRPSQHTPPSYHVQQVLTKNQTLQLAYAAIIGILAGCVLHGTSNLIFVLLGVDSSSTAAEQKNRHGGGSSRRRRLAAGSEDEDGGGMRGDRSSIELEFWSGDTTTTSTSTTSAADSRRSTTKGQQQKEPALDYGELFDSKWKLLRASEKPRRRRRGLLAQTIHEESSESDSL